MPIDGPAPHVIERLEGVPRDGEWRSAEKMGQLMGYRTGAQGNMSGIYTMMCLLETDHWVERREELASTGVVHRRFWRRI